MLRTFKERREQEEGFTLIELMVVVLIIAILIAIAIPTFLGAQNRARDRGAQSDLRNAMTAAKTLATDSAGIFQVNGTDIAATDMATAEPSLTYDVVANADTSTVGVITGTGGTDITLVKKSASGTYFCISATSSGVVKYGKNAALTSVDTAAECADPSW